MPTAADLIAAARRHVYGSDRQLLNQLATGVDADANNVTFTYPFDASVGQGSMIAVGLELMYVWSMDAPSRTATVQRGWNGSPRGAHLGGDLATANPRFSDFEVLSAINDDLNALCSAATGMYRVRDLDYLVVSAQEGYDFPATNFQGILDIRWQIPDTVTKEWRRITDYRVNTTLPTAGFPSGNALFVLGNLPTPGQTMRVTYASAFTPLGNLTDDVAEVTGLPSTAMDLPPMGAALHIMAGRPIARAQYTTQGDTRRAQEVTTNDVVQAPAALRQLRQSRIVDEVSRLAQQWPDYVRSRELMFTSIP